MRTSFFKTVGAALAVILVAGPAFADDYPSRPISMIVPFAPGGSTDLAGRLIARNLESQLGQPVVIDNRPGAGSMIGLNEIAEARPDGYTIGMTNSALINQSLYGIARFDYARDVQAVGMIGQIPFVLAVQANAPWQTLEDLIEHARKEPDSLTYGITGVGNTAHIAAEHLALEADISMRAVNFDSGAPLIASLLGGHIDIAANNPVDLQEHVRAGRVRVLAVFGEDRIDDPDFAHAPTAGELGYPVIATLWQGLGAPKGLPDNVLLTLDEALAAVMQDPAVQDEIAALGLVPEHLSSAAFAQKWLEEQRSLLQVVTDTGILETIQNQVQ